jgi:hypothetical protein
VLGRTIRLALCCFSYTTPFSKSKLENGRSAVAAVQRWNCPHQICSRWLERHSPRHLPHPNSFALLFVSFLFPAFSGTLTTNPIAPRCCGPHLQKGEHYA